MVEAVIVALFLHLDPRDCCISVQCSVSQSPIFELTELTKKIYHNILFYHFHFIQYYNKEIQGNARQYILGESLCLLSIGLQSLQLLNQLVRVL